MTYELAKQLEDAGFPQNGEVGWDTGDEQLIRPTLSELIEACGDGFTELKRMVGNPFNYTGNPDKTVWFCAPLADLVNEGGTPEEAVARLYLTLRSPKANVT